jgi:hypothetical protein
MKRQAEEARLVRSGLTLEEARAKMTVAGTAAVKKGPTTPAETAAIADQQRMGALESSESFAAKPGFGVGGESTGDAAGSASMPSMQISGHLAVSFSDNMATMVAEVINTSEVRDGLQRAGVLYKR